MKTIVTANNKGGVAKTTTAIAVAAGIARKGYRTLLIDLDAQGNASQSIRLPKDCDDSRRLLLGQQVQPVEVAENLWAIPSAGNDLITIEAEQPKLSKGTAVADALENVEGFDFCIIDTPPAVGYLTLNAIRAADLVLLPMQPNYLALQGVAQLTELLQQLGKADSFAVLATMYDRRKTMHRQLLATIQDFFGNAVLQTAIRSNVALAECPATGQTIYDYAPHSNGAADYTAVTEELLQRLTTKD